jgi:hypothetical protein
MNIYSAIEALQKSAPLTVVQAEEFVSGLSESVQKQLITSIYIGRDHIHSDVWSDDVCLSIDYIDHIPVEDFAQIVHEKHSALVKYLDSMLRCSSQNNFDLNSL